jgi:hypothetical protein
MLLRYHQPKRVSCLLIKKQREGWTLQEETPADEEREGILERLLFARRWSVSRKKVELSWPLVIAV